MKTKKREIRYLLTGLIVFQCVISFYFLNNSLIVEDFNIPQTSATTSHIQEWLTNNNFSSKESWYLDETDLTNDIDAIIDNGVAKFTVIGDSGIFSLVVDPSNTTEMNKWDVFKKNPYQLYPDNYNKTNEGFYFNHEWNEAGGGQDENAPAVYWIRNINIPVDMSDYIITSSFLEANFSALVEGIGHDTGGIEAPNDYTDGIGSEPQNDTLDYALFTVEIGNSNPNTVQKPIAFNQTRYLGDDDDGIWSYINETQMTNYGDETNLIADLTSVLNYDNKNFTVIIGIEVFCADNDYGADVDDWEKLLITSLNLTFTYKKKIDLYSSISWNQDGNKISSLSNDTITVTSAILQLKYNIDQEWTSDSTHSIIRVITNGQSNKLNSSIDLINFIYPSEFILITFDITEFITDFVNISIQLFLDDEFVLSNNITISIDDVELLISYTITTEEKPLEPLPDLTWLVVLLIVGIVLLITSIICIVSYFVVYQLYLRFPPTVRKIRSLKRKIAKGKKTKPVVLKNRESILKNRLREQRQILKIQPTEKNNNKTK